MHNPLPRQYRSLMAWTLYFSVLFSAWMCAIGHGQMTAFHLSGLQHNHCVMHAADAPAGHTDMSHEHKQNGLDSGCALCSVFSAVLLATLFGLFSLLKGDAIQPLPPLLHRFAPRDRWPLANPRASPI